MQNKKWRLAKAKFAIWLKRYGPAELVSIAFTYAGYYLVHLYTHNILILAYATAWIESISFYSFIIIRELIEHRQEVEKNYIRTFLTTKLLHLFIEFGPAELLDCLLLRPLFIGLGIYWMGPIYGLVSGKIASDIFFYIPVIVSYELRHYFHRKK